VGATLIGLGVALTATNTALAASYAATGIAALESGAAALAAWLAAAAPIAAVAAAIAAVLLLLDDVRVFFKGGDSLIADGIDKLFGKGAATTTLETARNLWTEIKEAVLEVRDALSGVIDKLAWIAKWSPPGMLIRTLQWVQGKEIEGLKSLGRGALNSINGNPAGEEYGPRALPEGMGGRLLLRAAERQKREWEADHPIFGPDVPPPAYLSPARERGASVTNTSSRAVTVQINGGDPAVVRRVVNEALTDGGYLNAGHLEAAAAAIPSTQ
jgi:hypothetical protein